jgi:poly(A) polymerase
MSDPVVLTRDEHPISQKDIDPDALKVLYRLAQFNHTAYLVGGSVRDLLVGRKPKDFDIGTSAHPYEVKRLFRNCWIIGRRFRLAHVKFGTKTIEVATFRRQVPAGTESEPPQTEAEVAAAVPVTPAVEAHADKAIAHENTFGTPEEDAFRRDFTVNALFYDVGTRSIIDYVGGLADIDRRLIRSIGDPNDRFIEDPVRMLRAIALAARLDFTIDADVVDAIARHRHEIGRAAPARLVEELYKILRSGRAERTFRSLVAHRLLEPIAPEIQRGGSDRLWQWLAALDGYRARFASIPESLTNAQLMGSLLVPLGLGPKAGDRPGHVRATLGTLPLARRDVERLAQILALQRRMLDPSMSPRARRALAHRSIFGDALTWLEIHGGHGDAVADWRSFLNDDGAKAPPEEARSDGRLGRRRRRRRRRRGPRPMTE